MTKHDKADEARKGLFDSVKGKVKEFAGAVTGNNSLTAEGQLEQTQARERKNANAVEAVANAEAKQARAQRADAKLEGAKERIAVDAETAATEKAIKDQQDTQKRAAEQVGAQQAARGMTQAELDAQRDVAQAKTEERQDVSAAADEFVDAVGEHQASVQEASREQAEADRIRARADRDIADRDI